jgi:hypothetical protein
LKTEGFKDGHSIRSQYRCATLQANVPKLKEIAQTYPFACLTLYELNEDEYLETAIIHHLYYAYYLQGMKLLEHHKVSEAIEKLKIAAKNGILIAYIELAQYYQNDANVGEAKKYFEKAGLGGLMFGYVECAKMNPMIGFDILKRYSVKFKEAANYCHEEKEKFLKEQKVKVKDHFTGLFDLLIDFVPGIKIEI